MFRVPRSLFASRRTTGAVVAAGGLAVLAVVGVTVPNWDGVQTASKTAVLRSTPSPSLTPTPSAKPSPTPRKPAATKKPAPRPAGPLYALPAPPVYPQPCPPPPHPPGTVTPLGPPLVSDARLPAVIPAGPRHVSLYAVSGKGMMLTTWPDSVRDLPLVVSQAKAGHLRSIWVRTGGTRQGYYGNKFLSVLLPLAHRAGLKVIAWDFPFMSDPTADAQRARWAFDYSIDGQRIDGFAPDIETNAEGTYLSPHRVQVYLSMVLRWAGLKPVVAIVMRPSSYELRFYPYAAEAPFVDAYAPMDYWSCNEPGSIAVDSVLKLKRLRPVTVIGQSYDMGPEGGRVGLPSGREIWRFVDASRRAGAIGANLWTWEQTRAPQWRALSAYPWF